MKINLRCLFFPFLALAMTASYAQNSNPSLDIGDPAPILRASKWLKGEQIAKFEPGHVYVVEFWATWCGACVLAMPHLADLAHTYKDQVEFLSVDAYEADEIKKISNFVQSHTAVLESVVADMPGETDGKDWVAAAGEAGIPTAFVIAKDGRIAWIGHPNDLDAALPRVLSGNLDYQAEKAHRAATRDPSGAIELALDSRQYSNALKLIKAAQAKNPNQYKRPLYIALAHTDLAAFKAQANKDIASTHGDPGTYSLVFLALDEDGLPPTAYRFGLTLSEEGLKKSPKNSVMLYARGADMAHHLGEKEKAIKLQTQAVKLADEDPNFQQAQRDDLHKDLESYQSMAKGGS